MKVVYVLWIALWTGSVFAADREVVFFVRTIAEKQSNEGDSRGQKLERWFNSFGAKKMGALLKSYSGTDLSSRVVFVDDLKDLDVKIVAALEEGEKLRGLVLMGHGGFDTFYMKGLKPGAKGFLNGREIAQNIIRIVQANRASRNFFFYSNACANFAYVQPDGSLASTLAHDLLPLTQGDQPQLDRVDLLGHRGMAGFFEWLPEFPTDNIYRKFSVPMKIMGYQLAVDEYKKVVANSVALAYVAAIGSIFFRSWDHGASPYALALVVPAAIGLGANRTLIFNYVAKSGRHILMSGGTAFVKNSDGEIHIRNGLKVSMQSQAKCAALVSNLEPLVVRPID